MSVYTDDQLTPFTWNEVLKLENIPALAGEDFFNYNETGRTEMPLYARRTILHQSKIISALITELTRLSATKVLGTFVQSYWTYAQVVADPDFLPWATIGRRRPASDSQILLWVNGQAELNINVTDTGINITNPLTSGQVAKVVILSNELIGAVTRRAYDGSEGEGVGNRIWALHNLPSDKLYSEVMKLPDSGSKLWVVHAGIEMTEGIDYTYTSGSGTVTITFTSDIGDNDEVGFTVFGL